MRRIVLLAMVMSAIVATGLVAGKVAMATNPNNPPPDDHQVTICHDVSPGAGNTGNGFTIETVDKDSISTLPNGHDGHSGDIIPAFAAGSVEGPPPKSWNEYAGKNLDKVSWIGNNCANPETPPTDVCPNLDDVQSQIPDGMILDEEGNCVTPPPPNDCDTTQGPSGDTSECFDYVVEQSCGTVTGSVTKQPLPQFEVGPYVLVWDEGGAVVGDFNDFPATFPEDYNGGSVQITYYIVGPEKDWLVGSGLPNFWDGNGVTITVDTDCVAPPPPGDRCPPGMVPTAGKDGVDGNQECEFPPNPPTTTPPPPASPPTVIPPPVTTTVKPPVTSPPAKKHTARKPAAKKHKKAKLKKKSHKRTVKKHHRKTVHVCDPYKYTSPTTGKTYTIKRIWTPAMHGMKAGCRGAIPGSG